MKWKELVRGLEFVGGRTWIRGGVFFWAWKKGAILILNPSFPWGTKKGTCFPGQWRMRRRFGRMKGGCTTVTPCGRLPRESRLERKYGDGELNFYAGEREGKKGKGYNPSNAKREGVRSRETKQKEEERKREKENAA